MSRSETRAWPTPPSAATPRPCLAARRGPILEDTRPQQFADEADDASVADAVFHESDEPILTDRIEEAPYVGVDDEIHLAHVYPGGQSIQRIVRSASGPAP